MVESNDQYWGLCDHGLVGREFDDDAEEDYGDGWDEFEASARSRLASLLSAQT